MCEHTPTLHLLDCFDVDHHGDNLSPPSELQPLPTNPNTAMFVGQDGGQWGGRERLEEGLKERDKSGKHDRREMMNRNWGMKESKGGGCTENRGRTRDGFTSRGMSFPLISCNRTSGIRREGCSRQSQ